MNHAGRNHALLSASGAHRWMECPASAKLEQQFPDTTSKAAKEGTLAHELCEMKLRHYMFTKDYGKRKLNADMKKMKENPLWSDEMPEYADAYVDYIKSVALGFKSAPGVIIEGRVDFSRWVPEGFGTADCILISGDTLSVIDFKYGKGVAVEAEHNPQLLLYALGAYATYGMLYPIQHIRLAIVQPRLRAEVSEWECSLDELLSFGKTAAERAAEAMGENAAFHPVEKACRFCRAKAQCRARAEHNVKLAFFTDKKPPLISNEEVGAFLTQGEDVAKWLSDLKDYALSQCLAGKEIPGYKAVEGRGARDWTDMDAAFAALTEGGISEAMLWEKKPLTLAQVEKTIGKKNFAELVGEYVLKKPGKPALVPASDKREAITNIVTAEEAFKEEI